MTEPQRSVFIAEQRSVLIIDLDFSGYKEIINRLLSEGITPILCSLERSGEVFRHYMAFRKDYNFEAVILSSDFGSSWDANDVFQYMLDNKISIPIFVTARNDIKRALLLRRLKMNDWEYSTISASYKDPTEPFMEFLESNYVV